MREPVSSRTISKYLADLARRRILQRERGAGTGVSLVKTPYCRLYKDLRLVVGGENTTAISPSVVLDNKLGFIKSTFTLHPGTA